MTESNFLEVKDIMPGEISGFLKKSKQNTHFFMRNPIFELSLELLSKFPK